LRVFVVDLTEDDREKIEQLAPAGLTVTLLPARCSARMLERIAADVFEVIDWRSPRLRRVSVIFERNVVEVRLNGEWPLAGELLAARSPKECISIVAEPAKEPHMRLRKGDRVRVKDSTDALEGIEGIVVMPGIDNDNAYVDWEDEDSGMCPADSLEVIERWNGPDLLINQ
jgi:hypothetical protein